MNLRQTNSTAGDSWGHLRPASPPTGTASAQGHAQTSSCRRSAPMTPSAQTAMACPPRPRAASAIGAYQADAPAGRESGKRLHVWTEQWASLCRWMRSIFAETRGSILAGAFFGHQHRSRSLSGRSEPELGCGGAIYFFERVNFDVDADQRRCTTCRAEPRTARSVALSGPVRHLAARHSSISLTIPATPTTDAGFVGHTSGNPMALGANDTRIGRADAPGTPCQPASRRCRRDSRENVAGLQRANGRPHEWPAGHWFYQTPTRTRPRSGPDTPATRLFAPTPAGRSLRPPRCHRRHVRRCRCAGARNQLC